MPGKEMLLFLTHHPSLAIFIVLNTQLNREVWEPCKKFTNASQSLRPEPYKDVTIRTKDITDILN